MATFLYKTKGNSSPERKPRVFFTCHPDDFEKHFKKFCEDIFKTHDCAIFYTEDLNEQIEEKYKECDLGQMNLFVIPVTFKLLNQPNRAMDSDFIYAQEKHIPVLPIMVESGLETIYSQKDKFGELQYLNPYVQDLTAISYEEKLKKYLESVLISNETAKRIRKAFDAYVFLSYRKKDRHYANELIKMIHSQPEFRDVAIWYDEFLTPGVSFRENIEHMLKDSKLFALLVTPNLLEYVDGQPNYVMAHEYPDAKKAGMDILPTEMEVTDKDELCSKFEGIPDCINPEEDEAFKKRLADALSKIAISENNDDPEHNFLIGLAYFDGIDVETNRARGLELITAAAEAGVLEAMEKCFFLCKNGGKRINYKDAEKWAEKIVEYHCLHDSEESLITLSAMIELAKTYRYLQNHHYDGFLFGGSRKSNSQKSVDVLKKVYFIQCKIFGKYHRDTLITLRELAISYDACHRGHMSRSALNIMEYVYKHQMRILGINNIETTITMRWLAIIFLNNGQTQEAEELYQKTYHIQCEILGETHAETIKTLTEWTLSLKREENCIQILYNLLCKNLGKGHWDTLCTLRNLAETYMRLNLFEKSKNTYDHFYKDCCIYLEEEDPRMLPIIEDLADQYYSLNAFEESLALREKVYLIRRSLFGEEDRDTILSIINLASSYAETHENYFKSMELFERAYALSYKANNIIDIEIGSLAMGILSSYSELQEKQIYLMEDYSFVKKIYNLRCEILGADHKKTIEMQKTLAKFE